MLFGCEALEIYLDDNNEWIFILGLTIPLIVKGRMKIAIWNLHLLKLQFQYKNN